MNHPKTHLPVVPLKLKETYDCFVQMFSKVNTTYALVSLNMKENHPVRICFLCSVGFFFFSFGFCLLLIFYPCATVPAAKLTPLWSLKADCFLIGAVPEVVVVMVTCTGYLEGLAGGRWVKVGGGQPLKKTEGSSYPRLRGGHFRK